ncbi:hypothetical protein FOMPIDRAFT_1020201 [Fomitopsis schrenkii]|uniref:Uncharacterized protein n=1 Tax=Fomitopsis schrenkii TaxID=2126942 RepID=S8DL03_FOMSC|nr:hypothetical protein FOMPIDRAFT_1020201 [Fomitopsis schrenkii]
MLVPSASYGMLRRTDLQIHNVMATQPSMLIAPTYRRPQEHCLQQVDGVWCTRLEVSPLCKRLTLRKRSEHLIIARTAGASEAKVAFVRSPGVNFVLHYTTEGTRAVLDSDGGIDVETLEAALDAAHSALLMHHRHQERGMISGYNSESYAAKTPGYIVTKALRMGGIASNSIRPQWIPERSSTARTAPAGSSVGSATAAVQEGVNDGKKDIAVADE